MSLEHLNPKHLHQAILSGCLYIIKHAEELNDINVFPVADGDTGSNMGATAKAVIELSSAKSSTKETLQSIAKASIIGAHGNSGIIFSQFLNGLTEANFHPEFMNCSDFAKATKKAAISVRQAINNPVEGTMLTLIEALAALANNATSDNLGQSLHDHLPDLEQEVMKTQRAIPALKKAHVVDSGALGFYHFIEGFCDYIQAPEEFKIDQTSTIMPKHTHQYDIAEDVLTERYCTEGVLRSMTLPHKETLKDILVKHGDSVVITGNSELCRFHVHTNTPTKVFSEIISHGVVDYPKVDDMQRESDMIHQKHHRIALVTDSCADLPQHLLDQYFVHLLPINLLLDDHLLLDTYSFDPNEFYQKLDQFETYPKTSLPTLSKIADKFEDLSSHYDAVIVISVSQALSGTFDAITNCAKPYSNIHVIDSKTASGAQGLLVKYAGLLIEQNLPIEHILQALNKAREQTNIFVAVDQFESLIRSGRVSRLKGLLGRLSGLKPIISIKNGQGVVCDKALSQTKSLNKLLTLSQRALTRSKKALDSYCIIHAGVEEKAKSFAELTSEALGQPPLFIKPVSTAIGLHAGYGAIAIATLEQP